MFGSWWVQDRGDARFGDGSGPGHWAIRLGAATGHRPGDTEAVSISDGPVAEGQRARRFFLFFVRAFVDVDPSAAGRYLIRWRWASPQCLVQ